MRITIGVGNSSSDIIGLFWVSREIRCCRSIIYGWIVDGNMMCWDWGGCGSRRWSGRIGRQGKLCYFVNKLTHFIYLSVNLSLFQTRIDHYVSPFSSGRSSTNLGSQSTTKEERRPFQQVKSKEERASRERDYLEHTHHDSLQGKNRRKFVFLLVRNYDYFCPRRKLLVRNPKFHT